MSIPTIGTIDLLQASLQKLHHPEIDSRGLSVSVLRLDRIHPVISGNKWFKLRHYLQKAQQEKRRGIATFGGPWSNHLLATALAARLEGMTSIGFIRGEKPANSNALLDDLEAYGMELKFLSREAYANRDISSNLQNPEDYLVIDEGGAGSPGVEGAGDILHLLPEGQFKTICCAFGTGTTMAGLAARAKAGQQIIGFSSLKIQPKNYIEQYVHRHSCEIPVEFIYEYHFGGYGRLNNDLLDFMETFYRQSNIPTDRVYTAKLFFGFIEEVKKGRFSDSGEICLIHSGGLSGNRSIAPGILSY